jgi:hypothetical protein
MEPAKCEYSDILITPDHLEFEMDEGSQFVPPTQDLFIKKAGSGLPAYWDAVVTGYGPQYWLELSTMSGSVPKRVRVHCKSIGMPAGEWNGEIKITPRVEGVKVTPAVIPVKLRVKGKEPEEPEEPKEPPGQPPEEPGQPPEEPPGEPPSEPPEKSWLRKFIEWLIGLFRNWKGKQPDKPDAKLNSEVLFDLISSAKTGDELEEVYKQNARAIEKTLGAGFMLVIKAYQLELKALKERVTALEEK